MGPKRVVSLGSSSDRHLTLQTHTHTPTPHTTPTLTLIFPLLRTLLKLPSFEDSSLRDLRDLRISG